MNNIKNPGAKQKIQYIDTDFNSEPEERLEEL